MAQTSDAAATARLLNLVTDLIEGAHETPLWASFLESLRRVTGADYSILILDPPGRPMDQGLQLVSGDDFPSAVGELFRTCITPSPRRKPVKEGKVSSMENLFHPDRPRNEPAYKTLVDEFSIVGVRLFRVTEPRGVDGWLIIARRNRDFSEQDEAVLSAMVRPLRGAVRSHVAAESDKFRSTVSAEAVRRLQCGWFFLNRDGYLLAADAFGDTILASSGVLSSNASGRLAIRPAKLEHEVLEAVAKLAEYPGARPRAISLRSDPWLDMLLVPARKKMPSDTAVPAVIAYIHGDNWNSADRCGQLSDMFDLAPSEARLALALCRGKSIAEAAIELGLALETARSYTKLIYAKTGTRGMADLVRIVMGSVLTLAPDA